ncbi:MAG: DUF3196 family protein [Traorella sp.]
MSNYYSECLENIERLIQEGKKSKALQIINEELDMIYIPTDFEEKLKDLKKQIYSESLNKQLTDEEIYDYLQRDEYFQLLAIKQLSLRNLRSYLDLIQEIFDTSESEYVKILLIICLVEQQITDEFKVNRNGLDICFIPSAISLPQDSDGVEKSLEYLRSWFLNEDPSFCSLCEQALMNEASLHLPFEIEEDESESLAYAIVLYVSKLMNCQEMAKNTLCEKNASQNDDFELLLYSNTI